MYEQANGSEEKFAQLARAYGVLKSGDRKKQYDSFLYSPSEATQRARVLYLRTRHWLCAHDALVVSAHHVLVARGLCVLVCAVCAGQWRHVAGPTARRGQRVLRCLPRWALGSVAT